MVLCLLMKQKCHICFSFAGLGGLLSSGLDAKLVPEHLLRLCLEHEWKFVSSHKSSTSYNFYKVLKRFCTFVLEKELLLIYSSFHLSLSNFIASFFQDSNAPMMAKMVKLLITVQKQILSLLSEWEDHPSLQKIMDVIEMLLAIPMDTPLAKVVNTAFSSCSYGTSSTLNPELKIAL